MSARTIITTANFTVTDAAGQASSVYRELALVGTREGGWLVAVTEPDPVQPEGDVLSAASIPVPDAAVGVFDELFALITDPATAGAGTH